MKLLLRVEVDGIIDDLSMKNENRRQESKVEL